jgi:hypothetical protein
MKLIAKKRLDGSFMPVYDSDKEAVKKIKAGDDVEIEIKRPRNLAFHRKTFSLFNLVFDNQEHYKNLEELRKDLTIEAGYFTKRYNMHGVEIIEAQSISFAAMNQDTFDEYYQRLLDAICNNYGMLKSDIEENLINYF